MSVRLIHSDDKTKFVCTKKTGPREGPGLRIAGVGAGKLPEGNMLHIGDSGRIYIRCNSEIELCEVLVRSATSGGTCQPCQIANRMVGCTAAMTYNVSVMGVIFGLRKTQYRL